MTRATMLAKKKAIELAKKKDAEENGDEGWDEEDGDTVYGRGMMLGMCVAFFVICSTKKVRRNGSPKQSDLI